ncbi:MULTISPECIES: RNase P subunit p30 family protein [unclassified Haladaptatus]|uniref:RNase P subunit p30 family protein n=1 Tax=unclassified Haladaptatus TaxID=2622732 RepID=UPI0023E76B8B|nr:MULTISPECIES: RNase P subunit p30 family protein [unclassified Haladaptatus]
MYEAVHAHPDGDSTVARFATTAATYGYDGIVVRNHGDADVTFDAPALSEATGIDVVEAIEIRADNPAQASGHVGNYRPKKTLLVVHGGSTKVNRFACEQERVDVLAHPMAGRGDVNHVLAKAAARNNVRLEFNFGDVLRRHGGPRVQALQNLRKLRELVEYYDAPFVVSGDPHTHLELRAPRELVALGEAIGFSRDQVERGLTEWGEIVAHNREVQRADFIEPGVRRGRYEEVSE